MASRINRILGHPFRRPKTDGLTKVKSEYEEFAEARDEKAEKKSAQSSQHSIESKGIHAEPTIEAKIDYSAEWTRCSCCLKELPQHQNQVNCVPTAPKVRSCSNCQGCLCKTCRVKGICHECTVRREIKLDPDDMMEYDEDTLRSIIHKLHYPPGGFHNCPKPFLVKQILVRFQMFDDWDPKKVVTPVEHLMPTAVLRLDELEDEDNSTQIRAVPFHHVGSKRQPSEKDKRESEPLTPERITVFQAEVERAIRLREERRLTASDEPQAAAASEGVDNAEHSSSSGHQHEAHQHKGEHLVEENGHQEPHRASHQHDNQLEVVELKDITSMADIKQLHKRQLKRILKEADVDYKSMNGRHEYQQAVAQLWNIYQLHERGPSTSNSSPGMKSDSAVNSGESVKAHKQLHRLQYKSQQHPSSSSKNNGSSVVLLRDLPATSFAEQMSTEQLQEILVYHNFDPAEYPERGDLVYAVLCLWHAIRRGTTAPQIVKEINKRPQNLNINTAKTQVAIKELASPIDIEKLDPIQLRNILTNNGVDPDQYETDQELYLGVVNLWSEVQDIQSSNSNVQGSRTVAATAKVVSKWLEQDQNSNAPLARIDEDITFIDDDEASDYDAIDGRISSDSD